MENMTKKELTIKIMALDYNIDESKVKENNEFKDWMKLSKNNLIEELEAIMEDNASIITQTEEKEKTTMPAMKENFVIHPCDVRLQMGEFEKATEAVEEKEDQEAVAAQPAAQTVYLIAKNEAICDEIIARMADQGLTVDGQPEILENKTLQITYKAETAGPIRAAFKACKSKANNGYNAAGLAIERENKKVEIENRAKAKIDDAQDKADEAKVKADNAKAKADKAQAAADAAQNVANAAKADVEEVEEESDELKTEPEIVEGDEGDWPGSFDE